MRFATCAGGGASCHVRGTGVSSRSPRAFLTASWYAVIEAVPAWPATSPRPKARTMRRRCPLCAISRLASGANEGAGVVAGVERPQVVDRLPHADQLHG